MLEPNEEPEFRVAVKLLKEKYGSFIRQFGDSAEYSHDNLMVMVAVEIAKDLVKLEKEKDTVLFTDKIQQLDNELKDYLKAL
jgi:cell division protein ZapA (FtsZ GTPase activity inhibitor)